MRTFDKIKETVTKPKFLQGVLIAGFVAYAAGYANGKSKASYLHIKYSNDGGETFTSNGGKDTGDYLGICTNFNISDPTTVDSYTWAKIKGEQGPQGLRGEQGPAGIDRISQLQANVTNL